MKILLAKRAGFCFGVKRAIRLTEEALQANPHLYSFGPIIHNPQMVDKLAAQGVIDVQTPGQIKTNAPVILRSHGVESHLFKALRRRQLSIIDATCPFVAKARQQAQKLIRQGYAIVVYGDGNHPEVIALCSYLKGQVLVAEKPEDLIGQSFDRVGLISQTTKPLEGMQALAAVLTGISREVRVINTICSATDERQNAALELAGQCDLMLVLGGRNSANTCNLAALAAGRVKTRHIETAAELQSEWFDNVETVGITAGASTPDWIILEVYNKITDMTGNPHARASSVDEIPSC